MKGEKMEIKKIEELTARYAEARGVLADEVRELEDAIEALRKLHLPRIKRLIGDAGTKREELACAIESHPELFEMPRTMTFHGVKVGLQKGKGAIVIGNEPKTIALIKKYYDEPKDYLTIVERVSRTQIAKLSATELKRLDIKIMGTDDKIVIQPADSEIDKLVEALLKEKTKDMKEAA